MSKARIKRDIFCEEMKVGNAIRNTVRNMAYNLENVITNLHGIVGDLHVLVAQIDSVANKMDSEKVFKNPENGIKSWLATQERRIETSSPSPNGMLSNNIKHWQSTIEKYETQDFTPDLDWSYLGLSDIDKPETKIESFNSPTSPLPGRQRYCNSDFTGSSTRILNSKTAVGSRTDTLEPGGNLISEQTSETAYGFVGTDLISYSGYYEKLVDDVLENMKSDDLDSDFSDDESIIETGFQSSSFGSGESYVSSIEFEAEYNRQVNPWTTFSSVVNALDSEDAFSADDILNDNYLESSYFNCGYEVNVKSFKVS